MKNNTNPTTPITVSNERDIIAVDSQGIWVRGVDDNGEKVRAYVHMNDYAFNPLMAAITDRLPFRFSADVK